ncbi:MAG: hypothetical protein J5822_03845 [Eubacteriaceae bacterium]|nr:hypothetical protein [Eubacteriaceae bacterium]
MEKKTCLFLSTLAGTVSMPVMNAYADPVEEVLEPINRLTSMLYSIASAVGTIILIYNVIQLALTLKSHDPSQRSNALLGVVAGVIIILIPQVVRFLLG